MDPAISISPELSLRVLRPPEAGALFALVQRNRDHLRKWLPWIDATRSPADSRRFLEMAHAGFVRGSSATFGIRLHGGLAGVVGFHGFDRTNKVTSLGYWLDERACGKGIMRKCVAACVDYAFTGEGMNRLYIRCARGNERSKRIPQALGFTFEGIQREAEWLYDHFVDLEIHSVLAREWRGLLTSGG